ncbi:hypothetical protein PHJA_000171300 [Phtheirospermum japonicum]|uniref:Mitochondrial transcription termination factor n=1 Tax=Phtheirospermum japonicum TaxID=374723 RepID=A0A830B4N7_9LAMI|nr:hypothetical protein PHJA_000171300 [Phtheirospermum japonicum]
MFAIFCKRRFRVSSEDSCIFVAQQFRAPENAVVLIRSCSTTVCENVSEKTFTISYYLVDSCGLSPNDVVSVSKKLRFNSKSPEKPDDVLKFLREYGFTDAHIAKLVTIWPNVLLSCPNKTLLTKLRFFRSIGVPLPVLAQKLSIYPYILTRSLGNSLIPLYNYLKSIVGLDERVVHAFSRTPSIFGRYCTQGISSNISILRECGVPQSTIISLAVHRPSLLVTVKERLAAYVDRVVDMGFDVSKSAFVLAIQVFNEMTESSLQHKMEVYRRCGWSESDINAAFLKLPLCMCLSEEKITASIGFLVNALGCKPAVIAQRPVLLHLSLEKRIKTRCLVVGIVEEQSKGVVEEHEPCGHHVETVRGEVLEELHR